MPLLLVLLTWLLLRGMNPDAEMFDYALGALDRFAVEENALERDILTVRSGMLRNYDPIVQEEKGLDEALGRLHEVAITHPGSAAPIERPRSR